MNVILEGEPPLLLPDEWRGCSMLNYCVLNGMFYIRKQIIYENALDFYDYLWAYKINYKYKE